MATPKPTPKPGVNYKNRTPQEQSDYERMQRSKKIGQGEKNIVEQIFSGRKKVKDAIYGPRLAALKKKHYNIPASPTN